MPNVPVPAAAPGLPLETRRMFLAAGSASAVFGALAHAKLEAAPAAPVLSPELARLIEAHRVAQEATFAAWDVMWDVEDGLRSDLSKEEAADLYGKASTVEIAELDLVCRHSCRTYADARAWARHLVENEGMLDRRDFTTAMRALADLPPETEEDL